MIFDKFFLRWFLIFLIVFSAKEVLADRWKHIKDEHFIVYYSDEKDLALARQVLTKSESYYDKIAYQLGYARYSNFWTWEQRAKIIIFPNQQEFLQNTRQPSWSKGYADRDSRLFHSRTIVTYRQEQDFLDGFLPHEISHLILGDFVGSNRKIPIWFDEGVAQLHEGDKVAVSNQLMKNLVKVNGQISLDTLVSLDVRKEKDPQRVKIFYAQSVSLVDFLLKSYGSDAFGNLCRCLRDGKGIEEALASACSLYALSDLEKKWLQYLRK